jgi:hypothetical protein
MKMLFILISAVIIHTGSCFATDVIIHKNDGSYIKTTDDGKTWTNHKAPSVKFVYDSYSKISHDRGKTWKIIRNDTDEKIASLKVKDNSILIEQTNESNFGTYELFDLNGVSRECGNIDGGLIKFDKSHNGIYIIKIKRDYTTEHIKLLF